MKKIFLILLMAVSAITASAEFRWGPTAGVNVSSFYWKSKLLGTHYGPGYQAGVMGEVMFPVGVGFDFGLRYNYHQATCRFGDHKIWASQGLGRETLAVDAIQIPISAKYKFTKLDGFEDYIAPYAFAGPLFSFTVNNTVSSAVEHPAGNAGVHVGAGGEFFKHWQLWGSYYWGLSYEVRTLKLDNYSARCQGWSINVAYLF